MSVTEINQMPFQSTIDKLVSNLNIDPKIMEAFHLGLHFANNEKSLANFLEFTKTLSEKTLEYISHHECEIFNTNILNLLNVSEFPISLTKSTNNLKNLLEHVNIYAPEKFYPKVHSQKRMVEKLEINTIDDIIKFNHQFKNILNHIVNRFETSELFHRLSRLNLTEISNQIKRYDKKFKINSCVNDIYDDQYNGSKLISITVKQANATFIFVCLGLIMFRNEKIEKMGLGLESQFESMDDMKFNFNWLSYIKAQFSKNIHISKMVDDKTFNTMCHLFATSNMMREAVINIFFSKKPTGCNIDINTIFETICKYVLYLFVDTLEPLLQLFGAKIIAFSVNEIVIEGMNSETLMEFIRTQPVGEYSYIAKRYLKINEYTIHQHKLSSGKKFYTKCHINKNNSSSIHCMHRIDSDNKLEAFEIVSNYSQ